MVKRLNSLTAGVRAVYKNLMRMLTLAWETDSSLTFGYYFTSGVGALFPIFASFIFKLFIDELIAAQQLAVSVPVILIALLASRYLINIVWEFVMWGLRGTYYNFLFRYKMQNALNYMFYQKVSKLDIAHFENTKTQDLITKASDTFTWRAPSFLDTVSRLFNNLIAYASSFVILIPFGFAIPIILTLTTIPQFLLRARFGKLQWSIYGSEAPEVRKLWYLRWLLSNKTAVTETRIFQSSDSILKRFDDIQNHLYDVNKKPVVEFLKVAAVPQFFKTAMILILAVYQLPRVLAGDISVGDFTFFISLVDRLADSATDMILNFGEMYENNLYINHYFEVLALPVLVEESAQAIKLSDFSKPPRIEFVNVSFTYPGSKTKVLDDISFVIEPGQNLAIVGVNGAGKTTIVKLLCRFYDVTQGQILVNGDNLKDLCIADWYKYLGTLFQEFMRYEFSVKENIMLGNPQVTDEEKMKEAIRLSGADEFVEKLPKKYDQILGRQFEGGVELSIGQWQKLAIARAFYEGAPVLILDEPTSAIDAEAEYGIFKNLNKYYHNKTLFLISHRFSTVRNADKIIVLRKGKIAEQGSHQDLLDNKGLYARMFEKQALGYK